MMISDFRRPHPTVQIPQWEPPEDPTGTINLSASPSSPYFAGAHSPQASSEYSPSSFAADYVAALQRYLPSNDFNKSGYELESDPDSDLPLDSFASDEFRMYEFKVRGCERGRSHDWTECPFAHPGEKARRRDPRLYHYSGIACPDFRKGSCKRGDACEFSHGVFECWLHPTRYRTQPCKDGRHCKRRVCFFAHSPDQIRLLSDSPSPRRLAVVDSPPTSPPSCRSKPHSLSELVERVRALQIRDRNLSLNLNSCSWGLQLGAGSPRNESNFGCGSLPSTSTPVGAPIRLFDTWNPSLEEEPPMERVESGKNLRAAMYAKLRKENSLDPVPDFGWVSELVK